MKRAAFTLFILMIIAIPAGAPAYGANTDTYAIVHTDEGRFSEVVTVGNSIYILFDTSIYEYNTTTHEFKRKFDIGLNYIGVDFTYKNGSFYIAGYQVKTHINSGGGNNPVITCPLPADGNFDIYNFTIWQTNRNFGIIKTVTLSKELYGGGYQTAIDAMHVVFGNNLVVAISGYNEDLESQVESYVYEVNMQTGAFIQKLNFTERINGIAFYNSTYYINLAGKSIDMYDENFSKIKSFTGTTYGMHFIGMDFSAGKAYLVGHSIGTNGIIKAFLEILTSDLSADIFYLQYNDTEQFNAVKHFGNYTYVVGNNNEVYIFDEENKLVGNYRNDMSHAYDLYDSQYKSIRSTPVPMKIVAFQSANGNTIVMWGGYYESDNVIYAYFISTDRPANWVPYNFGGAGFETISNTWEHYKYYIIAAGVLVFLMVISGGGRHE
ncbi:hypothetical protein AciM339_0225 [Aciduliprofundum sp. MAR08-339]|uniref:hypothetical protein n=1 Tax=Aciduliprofundum sp. (strain MAR08-339) TaxID=673860 RepID=UPI0002A4ABF3|nr:hypothetical protein AciM339_0193 [Aciduliprofundum sp. MAR08-339]AGB04122.1 hypothetical protein AciM339_0225 [Aciduliprofundum sp. MAR08-339]